MAARGLPVIEIGRLELNRNPRNVFAEVERSIFSPAHFVPGIGPSPDKMLQGRLFAYGDAHRYRVGINADHLPVNRPHATEARTNSRDGHLYDGRHGSAKNYEPNGFDHATPAHAEDDDLVQAGNLYRPMSQEERDRLIANLAGAVSQVSREDIVERAIGNFRNADADADAGADAGFGFGKRLKAAVQALRG